MEDGGSQADVVRAWCRVRKVDSTNNCVRKEFTVECGVARVGIELWAVGV